MKKRVISLALSILMCLSLLYIPVFAADMPVISASYAGGVVSVSGTGFSGGSGYMVRVVDNTAAGITALTQVVASSSGAISADITTGNLATPSNYCVYINDSDGILVAKDASIDAAISVTKYTLTVQAGAGGTITAGTGGSYAAGEKVTLTAAANSGYHFSRWTSNNGGTFADSNSASTTFTMPAANVTVTAEFAANVITKYMLTVQAGAGGTIIAGTSGSYDAGEKVTLTAAANSGYHFSRWISNNGGTFADSNSATTTFTMPASNVTVTAEFAAQSGGGGTSPGGDTPSDGGGTSSGGGAPSSSSPAIPAANDRGTTAPTGTYTATITAPAPTNTNGSAAAIITNAQLAQAVTEAVGKAAEQGAETRAAVEIEVRGAGTADSFSVTIPRPAFTNLAESNTDILKIKTSVGSIALDSTAIDAINGSAAGDAVISISQADTSALPENVRKKIGGRPVYDLTVTSGNTTISSFNGGTATVSLPYTPAPGEDMNKIVVYYISDSGELTVVQNCIYDAASGTASFKTKHFSRYEIGYNNVSFSDITGWYKDYVNYLAARGIIEGNGNGAFSPDANITRAQFVTILANLSGDDLSAYDSSSFTDVGAADWYSAAVQWAFAKGIVEGSNGKFNPDACITRQDIAVMLVRYAEKVAGCTLPATNNARAFTDSADIASYAKGAVRSIQQAGIISGYDDGRFAPSVNATRAQTAKMIVMLMRIMSL